jgi:hypothetical protein
MVNNGGSGQQRLEAEGGSGRHWEVTAVGSGNASRHSNNQTADCTGTAGSAESAELDWWSWRSGARWVGRGYLALLCTIWENLTKICKVGRGLAEGPCFLTGSSKHPPVNATDNAFYYELSLEQIIWLSVSPV